MHDVLSVRRLSIVLAATTLLAGMALGSSAEASPCGRTKVIAIYDSHGLTAFGDHLDRALLDRPDTELVSYTLGGASPSWLEDRRISPRGYLFESCEGKRLTPRSRLPKVDLRAPDLDDLLRASDAAYDRQVVILSLGSNIPGELATQSAAVERIVRRIRVHKRAVCIWVGPPHLRGWSAAYAEKVYASIRSGIHAAESTKDAEPACHLIDSRPLVTYPPGGDGTHLAFFPSHIAAAHRWAASVEDAIDQILKASPSRTPDSASGTPEKIPAKPL